MILGPGQRAGHAERATSILEILALVAVGPGVCLVPEIVARHHPRAEIAHVPGTGAEPAVVSVARRSDHTTPAIEAFIETVRHAAAVAQAIT